MAFIFYLILALLLSAIQFWKEIIINNVQIFFSNFIGLIYNEYENN